MIIEIDEFDLGRYSPSQLAAVRPDIVRLASIMRRNLRQLDGILGIEPDRFHSVREHESLRRELHEAHALADALREDLNHSLTRIANLERRLAEIEDDEQDALYASVGLSVTAHEVVVNAARRALLQHHHPDRWPIEKKAQATARFAAASATFDRIAELRR